MKKTSVKIIGVLIIVIVFVIILGRDKNNNGVVTDNSKNTQDNGVFLVSPQREVSVILIDKVKLNKPGFVAVHEVVNEKPGQVVEVSQYLDSGSHKNIEILLEESRQSKFVDISGEFPITSELVVVVYIDDGDMGFNPNFDTILEENKNVLARYVESGKPAPVSVIVPGVREKVNDVAVVVAYTNKGFSPNFVEINQGDTVEFINQSNRPMWVASNNHPAHDILSTFDQFSVSGFGDSWQYTFDRKGEWEYHDHVNASVEGIVMVK
jgi:plastocyanin